VGHDEPTASFYSPSPASGGNATWNATLPQDRSPTKNQSDLYAAAWFGLVVSDPAAYLGQCYIEVQLYPDFNWSRSSTTTSGQWASAVVGWQIDPVSGEVDTCYYSPMYSHGISADGYFSMTQGDSISVSLRGWATDTSGEAVAVRDITSGASSSTTLFNNSGGIALDPAYATNQFQNALLWTSGGQLPISFGFEIGREGNPGGISNSTFGGCTPGPGRSGPSNPSVPCPSYDPVSWVNDTLSPWKIDVPTFSSGGQSTVASQVAFSSTVAGNNAAITTLSNRTCTYRLGSSFCTYPWFGYSCPNSYFTFGATDFASETIDFGESAEFANVTTPNLVGLPVYRPLNFSMPVCGGSGIALTIDTSGLSGGTVSFLSKEYGSTKKISGLDPGFYSISASPPAGAVFSGWIVSGSVSVASSACPSTALQVAGMGSVIAHFATTSPRVLVWFNSTTTGSAVEVSDHVYDSGSVPTSTVVAGASISLSPGVYGIQAAPPSGASFDRWSVAQSNAGTITAARSPVTWLIVTGAQVAFGVSVSYTATARTVTVNLTGFGDGVVSLDGVTFPYDSSTGFSHGVTILGAGTYNASATPAAGWAFVGWSYQADAYFTNFNQSTNASFGPGIATLTATFAAGVTTYDSPAAGGRIALDGRGPLANRTVLPLDRGYYSLDALPAGFWSFSHWVVSDPTELWVLKSTYALTHLWVNGSGSVTAVFSPATNVSLTLQNSPAAGGRIEFDFQAIVGASTVNDSLAEGSYLVVAVPSPGWEFSHWTVSGPIRLASGILNVSGIGGVLVAYFQVIGYPISFVTGGSASVKANFSGQLENPGETLYLQAGTYNLTAVLGANVTFLRWVATGAISTLDPAKSVTNLSVSGGGTLFSVVNPFSVVGVTASPPAVDVGTAVNFTGEIDGSAPSSISWTGLPTGCASLDNNPLACVPIANGSFSVVVVATGPDGLPVSSPPLSFSVGNRLTITSFKASKTALDLGMSTTYSTVVAGGTSPFRYAYASLPTGCTASDTATLRCTPRGTGSTRTEVTVTDGVGAVAHANVTVSVSADLSHAVLISNRSQVTSGIAFELTVTVSGGSTPLSYSYTGLPAKCASFDQAAISCIPSTTGSFSVTVRVMDVAGATSANSTTVLVNPYPFVSVSANPSQVTLGQTITFTVNASGGTGALTYAFESLPPGCSSANTSHLSCRPNSTGTYDVVASVTDVDGAQKAGPTVVTVTAAAGPSGAATGAIPWWFWVGIVLALSPLAVAVVVRLRRRSPPIAPRPLPPVRSPPQAWSESESADPNAR